MSKNLVPALITLAVILIGVGGIFFLSNQKLSSENQLNLNPTPAPTSAIITPEASQNNQMQKLDINTFQASSSGLRIKDEVVGTGQEVKTGDSVTVHYIGTLANGEKFDSSYDRNQPFETQIGVGQVIKGWDEGIVGMRVGGKRILVIPPDLGYGTQGAGQAIPPNSTLIFQVELLGVK
nr:FKBP-type peptidyl-prolyl cis-trans isomerase [Candidatus Levybacteria bacterium]